MRDAQERLTRLRLEAAGLYDGPELGPPVCVVLEGWDASGKGGAIKRLVAPLDPRHVRVRSFAAPTPDELRHHWLWRFWPALPGWGGMAVLDRSWYGRVLVERVESFATPDEVARAYAEITDFERGLTAEGMVLVKLWLHFSEAEQLRRFEARRKDPLKAWKLTEDDWRNRAKRAEYEEAVELMLERRASPRRRGRRRGRAEGVGPRPRGRDRGRRDRGRAWPRGAAAPRPASGGRADHDPALGPERGRRGSAGARR